MQPNKVPEFGVAYIYGDVEGFYEHDATQLHFVIVNGPRICALRLREDYDPRILSKPAEVWVGERPKAVKDWGNILANDTVRVPVFVKRNGKQNYTFVGDHDILPRLPTSSELAKARAKVPHDQGVSRIVFLKRVEAD